MNYLKYTSGQNRVFLKTPLFLLFFAAFTSVLKAQKIADSLKDVSYDYMWERFYADTTRASQLIYTDAIIARAKKNLDTSTITKVYEARIDLYKNNIKIRYLDSLIQLSLIKSADRTTSKLFMKRGIYEYLINNDLKKALLDFIKAEEYNTDDLELKRRNYNHIGIVKFELGDKLGALDSYKKSLNMLNLESKPSELSYLSLYFNLSTIYNQLGKIDSALHYINKGIKTSKELEEKQQYYDLMINKGINYYYAKKYDDALETMQYYLDSIKNIHNIAHTHLYLGKIYKEVDNWDKALFHYKSTNKIIDSIDSYDPIYRELYVDLIQFYEKKNDLKNQYAYLSKLIKFDSVNNDREVYLNRNLFTDYEIPKLKAERDVIISTIKKKDRRKRIWIIVLLFGSLIVLSGFIYQYQKRKSYQTRFLALVHQQEEQVKEQPAIKNIESPETLDISEDIVNHILNELKQFEHDRSYLQSDLTLSLLAKQINSNTRYLSKVISYHKQKSFIQYINNLRVKYAVERLKTDEHFRKYTLYAIANELGFKKTESFTKAFKKVTGITPAYYIKELKKEKYPNS